MSIDVVQLKDLVIVPALDAISLYSPSAVNMLLGTAAQETGLGYYLKQTSDNPNCGLGIYQMQRSTYDDIWARIVEKNIALKSKIKLYLGINGKPFGNRLISDLSLATIMCRLFYYSFKMPLPEANDIEGMAKYWKKWFNSPYGKGTEDEFIENYHRYVSKDLK